MTSNAPSAGFVPHLWFDTQAVEAAEFYTAVFPESAITRTSVLKDTPSGDCNLVSFSLWGEFFEAISGGPGFQLNPSISFIVNFDPLYFGGADDTAKDKAKQCQAEIWDKLTEGGQVMIPLDEYPFSVSYGWVQDRYGVSWQLMVTRPEGDPRPHFTPAMMFTGENFGKAEEARAFYLDVFNNSSAGGLQHYGPGMEPNEEGTVMFSDMAIGERWLALMDSPNIHDFNFNEALSFIVYCDSQADIDHYWERLNVNPDGGQCGWLKDKYNVSWQILPSTMQDMIYEGSPEQVARLMAAATPMKKLDIAALQEAFDGK